MPEDLSDTSHEEAERVGYGVDLPNSVFVPKVPRKAGVKTEVEVAAQIAERIGVSFWWPSEDLNPCPCSQRR
jgi:hypothetical protein